MRVVLRRNGREVAMGLKRVYDEGGAQEKWEGCCNGVEESVR